MIGLRLARRDPPVLADVAAVDLMRGNRIQLQPGGALVTVLRSTRMRDKRVRIVHESGEIVRCAWSLVPTEVE